MELKDTPFSNNGRYVISKSGRIEATTYDEVTARIFAAAPELLEALQELSFLYEHDEGCRELTEYKRAKAAIAKATGH